MLYALLKPRPTRHMWVTQKHCQEETVLLTFHVIIIVITIILINMYMQC